MFINFLNSKKEKGFNLFTALVALLLVSITLVLIFNMIKTEETNLSLIQDQSSSSDLITVANLARADAFDVFVVSLRSQWEYRFSDPNNYIKITRNFVDYNWDTFVNQEIYDLFSDRHFSRYVAKSIVGTLQNMPNPVGYTVNVTDMNELSFQQIFDNMFNSVKDTATVVDCNQASSTCVGSFYLPFTAKVGSDGITEEQYDQLPKVTVLRLKNNEVIQIPIFGKQVYKIYMPWRGFQALRVVRRIANSKNVEQSSNPIIPNTFNKGFFDAKLHNTLEQARLGVCDPGTCAPRQYLFQTPSENGFPERCDPSADGNSSKTYVVDNIGINDNDNLTVNNTKIALSDNTQSYDIRLYGASKTIFEDLIKTTLKNNLKNRYTGNVVYLNSGLVMSGDRYPADVNVLKISVSSDSHLTKEVLPNSNGQYATAEDKEPSEISSYKFNPNDSSWNNSWGLGLGLDSDGNVVMPQAQSSWIPYSVARTSENRYLKCSELSMVDIDFKFSETDKRYKIRNKINNEDPFVIVRLEDDYAQFRYNTPTLKSLFHNGLQANGYFDYSSNDPKLDNFKSNYMLTNSDKADWTCNSYMGGDELKKACIQDNQVN